MQWVSTEFLDLYVINTTRLDFDCSMETMRLLVGLTNKARGYPGSILVCVLTNRCWVPLVGRIIVMRIARMSHSRWTRLYLKLRVKQSRKKCFVAKALWTKLPSEQTHMDLQHLFFDSMEELSRQSYFQWIYFLRGAGIPEISVQPCRSFSSGNSPNDNLSKSR